MKKLLLLLMIVPMIGFGQTAYDYCEQGNDYHKEGEYQLAIENYNRAISIDPDYEYAYYRRGNLYRDLKNYDYSISDYTRAIRVNPDYIYAYLARGGVYYDLELWFVAITDFTIAVEIDPEYNSSYMYRGMAKEKAGLSYCSDYKRACDLEVEACCEWYDIECK